MSPFAQLRAREDKLRELAGLLEAELHDRGVTTDADPAAETTEELVDLCLSRGRALRYGWSSSR